MCWKKNEELNAKKDDGANQEDISNRPSLLKVVHTQSENEVKLCVDNLDNIVAIGTIPLMVESDTPIIHGNPLKAHHVRVSVLRSIVKEAAIPVPISPEIMTVLDAVGTFVQWPKGPVIIPESLFKDGRNIHLAFGTDVFGHQIDTTVERGEVFDVVNLNAISPKSTNIYMSHLHVELVRTKREELFNFIDTSTSNFNDFKTTTIFSRAMANRFNQGKHGQHFVVPYLTQNRWRLTIIDAKEEIIHFMDPRRGNFIRGTRQTTVENAVKMHNV